MFGHNSVSKDGRKVLIETERSAEIEVAVGA
jgi:hypothetical protein